jgi:acylphosphatase
MAGRADGIGREQEELRSMAVDLVRRRVILHGLVQGVWFRASVRERARAHGVAGWARNRPDGVVEVALEGQADAVESVLRYCRTGPPGARVDSVEVREEPPEGIRGFTVR